MAKLHLPSVTLCAATSVNVDATIAALSACIDQVRFANCLLFTDGAVTADHRGISVVPIERLSSSSQYSNFMLRDLVDHVRTPHCLVVQWDGFVLDARSWDPQFLEFDYIGAPWPQFDDGHDVGNGGFSLRSRKLLEACRDPAFDVRHPEDLAICQNNRPLLEGRFGIRFADRETATHFAFERAGASTPTFGFHGIFNMIPAVGPDRFWELYSSLDDPATAFVDYSSLMIQLGQGPKALRRRMCLSAHLVRHLFGR